MLYFNQTPIQTSTMVTADTLKSITINVSMVCTTAYGCGLWTSSAIQTQHIQLIQTWKSVSTKSQCYGMSGTTSFPSSVYSTNNVILTVCFSSSSKDGIKLALPFNNTAAVLNVVVEGLTTLYNNDMYQQLDIAANQWKTIYFSQTVSTDIDLKTTPLRFVKSHCFNKISSSFAREFYG